MRRFRGLGIEAERVPHSGAMGGSLAGKGDIEVSLAGRKRRVEVKVGKDRMPKTIIKWMQEAEIVLVKDDRATTNVIIDWSLFAKLIGGNKPKPE